MKTYLIPKKSGSSGYFHFRGFIPKDLIDHFDGEKERLPEEFQYEFEQEMLKHIHELKNELREKGWTQRDLPPEVHQPSFLRGEESDAQLGFKFE